MNLSCITSMSWGEVNMTGLKQRAVATGAAVLTLGALSIGSAGSASAYYEGQVSSTRVCTTPVSQPGAQSSCYNQRCRYHLVTWTTKAWPWSKPVTHQRWDCNPF
jgi:hypothetical protein